MKKKIAPTVDASPFVSQFSYVNRCLNVRWLHPHDGVWQAEIFRLSTNIFLSTYSLVVYSIEMNDSQLYIRTFVWWITNQSFVTRHTSYANAHNDRIYTQSIWKRIKWISKAIWWEEKNDTKKHLNESEWWFCFHFVTVP